MKCQLPSLDEMVAALPGVGHGRSVGLHGGHDSTKPRPEEDSLRADARKSGNESVNGKDDVGSRSYILTHYKYASLPLPSFGEMRR